MPHVLHVFTVPESLAFLRGQPAFMRGRGYDMAVVSSPGPGLAAFGVREGVATHAISMPRRISPGQDAASLARLVALMRRLRPDIVHAHTPKGGLLGTIAATIARIPVKIYHMRGLPLVTAVGTQRVLLRSSEQVSCGLATKVLAVSRSLRDVAIAERLCPSDKISVLAGGSGNGVDGDRFDPERVGTSARAALRARLAIADDAPVIGFVGRLVRDKGIVELLNAFREVKLRHPGAHLVVGGVFEERDPVPPVTRRALEDDRHVHLLGYVDDTPSVYAAIDVLALPSYREGFPNVPLEAAAMRLPVVTTQVPGCVDAVVDGLTGTLVPARDASALARALDAYLDDPALRARHGNAGRARVEASYRRERIWEALAGVYDELLGR
ncbi:glycosyltransferase family 4 protein [soil metagenome]